MRMICCNGLGIEKGGSSGINLTEVMSAASIVGFLNLSYESEATLRSLFYSAFFRGIRLVLSCTSSRSLV
jgi:hypothetical protein